MRNVTFYRKILLKFFLIIFVCITGSIQAQSIKRQCISSYGNSKAVNGTAYMQTVGQPFNTNASYESNTTILLGFQQPVVFKVEKLKSFTPKIINLSVYPNPATFKVTIQSEELIENSSIQVTDIIGKVIMTDNANQFQLYELNCETWTNGIYFITISDKYQNKSSLKLIINK